MSNYVKEQRRHFKIYRIPFSEEEFTEIEEVLRALPTDPDGLIRQGTILKEGRKTESAEIILCGRTYFLKQYHNKTWPDRVKNVFRRSKAIRIWLMTRKWEQEGFPVPKPLFCFEERRFGCLRRSYILSEFLENSRRLTDIWPDLDDAGKKRLLIRLADVLGKVHRAGGIHGDLKWNNILIEESRESERIVLCDMDASRFFARTKFRKVRKDIDRFCRDLDAKENGKDYKMLFLEAWEKRVKNGLEK